VKRHKIKKRSVPKASAIWNGKKHNVEIYSEFEYQGIVFGTLSDVARYITGKPSNGIKFFGVTGIKGEL
jgi:hypothetical protein